ncbi:MAG TPA: peptidylprolyl isomerase [Planctomycetota bacterium]|nr:peptidylprolyl isomerase [Planctomycetota bacterium]
MIRPTRYLAVGALLLLPPLARAADPLPADVAAAHPEGKWKIRKADLYRYLARFEATGPNALAVLPEYLKMRLVEDEAKRRGISVSEEDVDRWIRDLDQKLQAQALSLDDYCKHFGMRREELRRKGRQWVLMDKVAAAVLKEKDPTRGDAPASDDSIIFVVDTLYKDAKKETEGLPEGIVARIRGIDITEYEYGRALAMELPQMNVLRALRALILEEETALLVGDRNPPLPEDLAEQKRQFLETQKERIRAELKGKVEEITDDMVEQVLRNRGASLDLVFRSPEFLARARAIGYFRRSLADEDLVKYYDDHKGAYGEQLRVARILVGARGQEVPRVGKTLRTVEQGKKESAEIYEQLKAGQDFQKLAQEKSEDPDLIRKAGGVVPFWITAATPGYDDTFKQAEKLGRDEFSRPFFSEGRGYVIVKLLDRKKAPTFEDVKDEVRADAARDRCAIWYKAGTDTARINDDLFAGAAGK